MDHALRVLEFDAIRQELARSCETPLGRDLALALRPRVEASGVRASLAQTAEALWLLDHQPPPLVGIHDVREPLRLAAKKAVLDGEVLARVARYLGLATDAQKRLRQVRGDCPGLGLIGERLPDVPALKQKLDRSLDEDGQIRDGASSKLDTLRSKRNTLAQRAQERIQSYVNGPNRSLLSDPIYTLRDGRYVLPLKAENKGKIKGVVHDTSGSGLTIYVEPQDVLAISNDLRGTEGEIREEERRILADLSNAVGAEATTLGDGLEATADLDLALARARDGRVRQGTLPVLREGHYLKLETARHPLLDREIAVPLSLEFGGETNVLLITGPNTGGKTVAIKAVGLAAMMAQSGMMPCATKMEFGCFTQFWADIGDEQSLQQSLSTFSAHIRTVAEALNNLEPGALVLLDEVGAGTDPAEGAALAKALLTAFQGGGAMVMASTHFGELKVFASTSPGFLNASMEFDRKSLRPTYHLLVGVPGSSHALHIAKRYGVPEAVVQDAEEGIDPEQRAVAETIQRLEISERQARAAQSEADRLSAQLRRVEQELSEKVERAEESRRRVGERAANELDEALRQIRMEAGEIFEGLRKGTIGREEAREKLRGLDEVGRDFAKEMRPAKAKPKLAPTDPKAVVKGAQVRLRGLNQEGTVLDEPKGGKADVQIGAMRMNVDIRQLDVLAPPPVSREPRNTGKRAQMMREKAQTSQREVNLRRLRYEDAQDALEKFIDEALLGGLDQVRIVHGKGEGVLRKMTHQYLRGHKGVKSYEDATADDGGDGVTVAVLK